MQPEHTMKTIRGTAAFVLILLALLTLLLLATAACSSVTEPEQGELYVLVRADGDALPITRDTDGGVIVTLTADSIRVLDGLRYERTLVAGVLNSAAGGAFAPSDTGVLVALGDGFVLVSDSECDDVGQCAAGDTIVFQDSGAEIRSPSVLQHATLQADGHLEYALR